MIPQTSPIGASHRWPTLDNPIWDDKDREGWFEGRVYGSNLNARDPCACSNIQFFFTIQRVVDSVWHSRRETFCIRAVWWQTASKFLQTRLQFLSVSVYVPETPCRDVLNSNVRPACTLGGRYPHHSWGSLRKEQTSWLLIVLSSLWFFKSLLFKKRKNLLWLGKFLYSFSLHQCHDWVLNIPWLMSSCLYSNTLLRFWVHRYISDLYLTVNWSATLFFFSTLFTTHNGPPSIELVCNQSPLQCFYVNNHRHILHRHSNVTLVLTSPPLRTSRSFCSLSSICSSVSKTVGSGNLPRGWRTWLDLTITFWNEIILDEIIEDHILNSRELRVSPLLVTRVLFSPDILIP